MPASQPCTLGIDIGTSKIAALVKRAGTDEILSSNSLPHDSLCEAGPRQRMQSVNIIFERVREVLANLGDTRNEVTAIGLTGQMHGTVLWNSDRELDSSTRLATWEDKRSSPEDLAEFRQRAEDQSLNHGFGMTTLAWLAKHEPIQLREHDRIGTIHAVLGAYLAGSLRDGAKLHPSDAASLGLFDIETNQWRRGAAEMLGIPDALLPEIVDGGAPIGLSAVDQSAWLGVPRGVPVAVAIGDNQASLYATIRDESSEMNLTIGTGGQLSAIFDRIPEERNAAEVRPYLDGKFALVGAGLSGGRALRVIAEHYREVVEAMTGSALELDTVYPILDRLAVERFSTSVKACTSFQGERGNPARRGSFENISTVGGEHNFSCGDFFAAAAKGMVHGLAELLPASVIASRSRIVGSGNAFRRLAVVPLAAAAEFSGKEIVALPEREEAAFGAARFAERLLVTV